MAEHKFLQYTNKPIVNGDEHIVFEIHRNTHTYMYTANTVRIMYTANTVCIILSQKTLGWAVKQHKQDSL